MAVADNERKNEQGKIEYKQLCREKNLLQGENKYKWNSLREGVQSGKIDSRELKIEEVPVSFSEDDVMGIGQSWPIGNSGRLFRHKIKVNYFGRFILDISDIIVVRRDSFSMFVPILAVPYMPRSCYGDLTVFDKIINYHYY